MPEGGSTNRGEGSESPRDLERSPSREAAWEDTDEERSLDEGQIRAALEAAPEGDNRMASPEVPLAQGIRVVEAGPLFLTRAEGQVIERRLQEEWRERNPGWETLPEDAMELRMHMDNAPMLEDVRTRVMLGEARVSNFVLSHRVWCANSWDRTTTGVSVPRWLQHLLASQNPLALL